MPKAPRCQPCVSSEVRSMLLEAFPDLEKTLAPIADCEEGKLMELCGVKAKSERAPTKYQSFVSSCMASSKGSGTAPERMSACAVLWGEEKAKAAA